jgi:hypothetical protein
VISARIGDEIDGEERDYFGLFPGFKGFVSARAYITPIDTVIIVVQWQRPGTNGNSTITLSHKSAAELRRYVEHFESAVQGHVDIQWDYLSDLAKLPKMSFGENRGSKVVAGDDREVSGTLLFASKDILLLWRCEERYRWSSLETCSKPIVPGEITQIKVSTGTGFWKGMGGGAAVGFVAGLLVMGKLDEWGEASDIDFSLTDYLVVTGVSGGIGLLAGALFGGTRGSEDTFEISHDPSTYYRNLNEIKMRTFFREYSPPEFREYGVTKAGK